MSHGQAKPNNHTDWRTAMNDQTRTTTKPLFTRPRHLRLAMLRSLAAVARYRRRSMRHSESHPTAQLILAYCEFPRKVRRSPRGRALVARLADRTLEAPSS